jgi:HD-GYP domain-containing protein (c-di-GMP phosphodiesterase class II)
MREIEIHEFAKWVGIIDAYDAMTNPRPYRKLILPHEALDVLYAGAGSLYDKDKVELFRDKLLRDRYE